MYDFPSLNLLDTEEGGQLYKSWGRREHAQRKGLCLEAAPMHDGIGPRTAQLFAWTFYLQLVVLFQTQCLDTKQKGGDLFEKCKFLR